MYLNYILYLILDWPNLMLLLFLFVKIEVTGNSFYKYIHPCDHEELSNQLGGQIPLEDMEIFDGLFCSDSVFMMSNHLKGGSKHVVHENPHKSFFLRMKSTLTSRGKNVNLRASTYRVRTKNCVNLQCCNSNVKLTLGVVHQYSQAFSQQ